MPRERARGRAKGRPAPASAARARARRLPTVTTRTASARPRGRARVRRAKVAAKRAPGPVRPRLRRAATGRLPSGRSRNPSTSTARPCSPRSAAGPAPSGSPPAGALGEAAGLPTMSCLPRWRRSRSRPKPTRRRGMAPPRRLTVRRRRVTGDLPPLMSKRRARALVLHPSRWSIAASRWRGVRDHQLKARGLGASPLPELGSAWALRPSGGSACGADGRSAPGP
mmetsp:Transcript_29245/g.84015  ORF Transcript_29245/g.84015 Transcript_29245/m.84015 type:complete len:225 (+) Transcript_29245:2954-3628(+)